MIHPFRTSTTLAALALAAAPALAAAQAQPPANPNANPPASNATTDAAGHVLSSHQIDRYAAIKSLQQELKSDPNNLADWIILGELAQEVATEVEPAQAQGYYHLATDAFAHAQQLAPDNASVAAAAQFAKDQESNATRFDQGRQNATQAYLQARRQELGNPQTAAPTVRTFGTPITQPAQAAQNAATGYPYGYPYYRGYTNANGQPYTYDQYTRSYLPQNYYGNANANANAAANGTTLGQPMTMRQYVQQFPNIIRNEASNGAMNLIRGSATNPAAGFNPPAGAPR